MRIRRGLSSRHLPCGCIAGIYETYRDEIVAIVDAPSATCTNPGHHRGTVVPTRDAVSHAQADDDGVRD